MAYLDPSPRLKDDLITCAVMLVFGCILATVLYSFFSFMKKYEPGPSHREDIIKPLLEAGYEVIEMTDKRWETDGIFVYILRVRNKRTQKDCNVNIAEIPYGDPSNRLDDWKFRAQDYYIDQAKKGRHYHNILDHNYKVVANNNLVLEIEKDAPDMDSIIKIFKRL